MASITERIGKDGKKKSYRVIIRVKGHPRVQATFKRKSDADKWAEETETDIRRGLYFKTAEAKKHSLRETIDRYISEELPKKKSAKDQLTQLNWWRDHLGDYNLFDANSKLIKQHRDELAKSKRTNATVNRYLAALSHVFTVAMKEWEWIEDNPMRKVSKLSEPPGRVRFLNKDDELPRLLEACRNSSNTDLYTVVILSLSTGARRMEIWSLKWNQVDLVQEKITLYKTKNKEIRVLPLKGEALLLMQERFAKRQRLDTDFVFPGKNPQKPMDFRAPWTKALEKAKIEDFRWHDLRHTAASYLAMNKASELEIAHILGHKSLAMVKRYSHLGETHTADIVESMNKKMLG